MPNDHKEKWEQYKDYCRRDVDAEVEIALFLEKKIEIPSWERELQIADYNINKRGVRIDDTLARNAVLFWNRISEELRNRVKEITGLENPDSIQQLKSWLGRHGLKAQSLDKAAMTEYLTRTLMQNVRDVLLMRRELGKTSVKKYETMLRCQCSDGRAHGITQYYGTVTGRWAGRMIQVQNLHQNHLADLGYARNLLRSGAFEEMRLEYDSIPDTLSQLIRTALIPSDGNVFHVCDFSAIEARVTAWLSGEQWVLDAFVNGGDIYCVTASRMFGVEVTKHGEHGRLRQPGKVAVLACGYGGGPAAFDSMAKNYGLHFTDEEKIKYVRQWRKANPNTVRLWSIMERAAMAVIQTGRTIAINRGLRFSYKYGCLFIKLPSGRSLCYPRAKVTPGEKGDRITYERQSQTTKKWEITDTYGGRLVENCIAEGALILTNKGYVRIQDITTGHLIWDGVEYVRHEGLINKGVQDVISVNGVYMTPDHKILTTDGWKEANKVNRLDWEKVRKPYSYRAFREQPTKQGRMGLSMRLREYLSCCCVGSKEKEEPLVRLYEKEIPIGSKVKAWNDKASFLRRMAQYGAKMYGAYASRLEELWRSWDIRMRGMAKFVRVVLGGYEGHLQEGLGIGSNRQQQGLLERELSLDNSEGELSKQKGECVCNDIVRNNDGGRVVGNNRYREDNNTLPNSARNDWGCVINETGCKKQVYDIRNCGSRNRFAVRLDDGRLGLVHNCVQGIARDILGVVILRCEERGYNIAFHVHDEVIVDAPPEVRLEDIEALFSESIEWAKGLPLKGSGYTGSYYFKD